MPSLDQPSGTVNDASGRRRPFPRGRGAPASSGGRRVRVDAPEAGVRRSRRSGRRPARRSRGPRRARGSAGTEGVDRIALTPSQPTAIAIARPSTPARIRWFRDASGRGAGRADRTGSSGATGARARAPTCSGTHSSASSFASLSAARAVELNDRTVEARNPSIRPASSAGYPSRSVSTSAARCLRVRVPRACETEIRSSATERVDRRSAADSLAEPELRPSVAVPEDVHRGVVQVAGGALHR